MAQTFNDLYNERKKQTAQGLLGFLLWTFIETAAGIVREHVGLMQEMNPMKSILANLRVPALISFLAVLPFMLLEFTFVILKGLNFDLKDARDSMVIFGFLWLGMTAILLILKPMVRNMRARNKGAANPVLTQENAMKSVATNPASAAMIGFILALPFLTVLLFLLLGIEPPLGPLAPLLHGPNPGQPNVFGTLLVLGALLLSVLACLIARAPIVRTIRAGGGLFAHPINLMLAAVIVSFVAMFVVGLIVDQFPCWIGVPNCD